VYDFESQFKSATSFRRKPLAVQRLILETVQLIYAAGIPIEQLSSRRAEKMAMVLLALANVSNSNSWISALGLDDARILKSREIIQYVNSHLGEKISSGSYDDIRRQDLPWLLMQGIVEASDPSAAKNNPTRGYGVAQKWLKVLTAKTLTERLRLAVIEGAKGLGTVREQLAQARPQAMRPVTGAEAIQMLEAGGHNELIKAVVTEFLPRFGYEAEVLYVGDASNKLLFYREDQLAKLGFFELSHGELPDVVAYSASKNWLYLVECVYSSGPVSVERKIKLDKLLEKCTAGIVYVTAFPDKQMLRKFVAEVAWESEVWLATDPDHLLHFNGDRFLGPHASAD
jgi:type II restriction enzyme